MPSSRPQNCVFWGLAPEKLALGVCHRLQLVLLVVVVVAVIIVILISAAYQNMHNLQIKRSNTYQYGGGSALALFVISFV